MTIRYHKEVCQGTDEWAELRRGKLTASEMKHVITPATLKCADNDKSRGHLLELAAQRISGFVEPCYVSDDMLRGQEDEIYAREYYDREYAKTSTIGFVTNDKWGFVLGYSPDFLVGDEGQGECKSRRQKYQVETIISGQMPAEYAIQVQTGLLVTERAWCDFISYSGGLPMFVKRIHPDEKVQNAIVEAAGAFHEKLDQLLTRYGQQLIAMPKLIETKRVIREEIYA